MEMEIEAVTTLVGALEKAALMAKQLPSTATTATATATIYASLEAAHRHLSLFLAQTSPPPQPSDVSDDAPMQLADEEQLLLDGEDSKMVTVDSVEERMKDCFIHKNKRRKRPLSPTSVAAGDRRRWLDYEIESDRDRVLTDYDPHVTKLRALDLIYQFHC